MRIIVFTLIAGLLGWWMYSWFPPADQGYSPHASPAKSLAAEQTYHAQIFDYVMNVVQTQEPYAWEAYATKGAITAGTPYESKSGSLCRDFSETYTITGNTVLIEGVACKREGREGWCRLKKSNALTCALESPTTVVGLPGLDVNIPGMGSSGGHDISVDAGGNVSGPGVGGVGSSPNVGKTKGTDVADTVTKSAGSVAGPTTSGAIKWFDETFHK